ncbi:hypothetical protein [Altericroceibacterium endophyticum]|uniref:Uncharacterized protein n=1 Tax=Altericroceibacterium endophyticum TaxID=1808508 RepID=A0A6I4T9R5_9SPHN|nr:hypothetical protein [Altericroceibacterium endophyticum]MXO67032.1 hypothetical protein [Altericroceibacterium endophyticum]
MEHAPYRRRHRVVALRQLVAYLPFPFFKIAFAVPLILTIPQPAQATLWLDNDPEVTSFKLESHNHNLIDPNEVHPSSRPVKPGEVAMPTTAGHSLAPSNVGDAQQSTANAPEKADTVPYTSSLPADERRRWFKKVARYEAAFQMLNLVDAVQTYTFVKDHGMEEANPLYGKDPSLATIAGIKFASAAVHFLASRFLVEHEPDLVLPFQKVTLAIQGGVVTWNMQHTF